MADGWCGSLISIDLLDPRVASLQASDCPRTLYSLMVFLGPTMRMRRRRRRFDSMTISRSCEGASASASRIGCLSRSRIYTCNAFTAYRHVMLTLIYMLTTLERLRIVRAIYT